MSRPALLARLQSRIKDLPLTGKFSRDVSWNLASFVFLGLSGILLNIIVGRFYGAEILGVFNQVFAIYIFLSQLAVFGLRFSVLKHVAEFSDDQQACNAIISSAIAVSALCAGVVSGISWLLSDWFGSIFNSPRVAQGWLIVLPGFFCFALNKVLMGVLNGFREMKAYAFATGSRYILMVIMLIGCVLFKAPGYAITLAISWGEIILLFALLWTTRRLYRPVWITRWSGWGRRHFVFGAKSFLSGTLAELNTRVDVIMLGYFTTDRAVGIYSMAALIVEGFMQVLIVVRDNLNPLLTKYATQNRKEELKQMTRRGLIILYPAVTLLGLIAVLVYPYFIKFFVADQEFLIGWLPFGILMAGLVLASGYLPFNMFLVQAGFPGLHTFFEIMIVGSNIVLNALFIPRWGLYGAAAATALSFILSVAYLKLLVKKRLDLKI